MGARFWFIFVKFAFSSGDVQMLSLVRCWVGKFSLTNAHELGIIKVSISCILLIPAKKASPPRSCYFQGGLFFWLLRSVTGSIQPLANVMTNHICKNGNQ